MLHTKFLRQNRICFSFLGTKKPLLKIKKGSYTAVFKALTFKTILL